MIKIIDDIDDNKPYPRPTRFVFAVIDFLKTDDIDDSKPASIF